MKLFQKIRQGDFLVYFLAAGLLAQSYLSTGLFLKVAPSSGYIGVDLGVAIAFAIGVDLIALTLATMGKETYSWGFAVVSMLINVGDLYEPSIAIISAEFAMLLLVSIAIPSVTATYSHIATALMSELGLHTQIAELKQRLASAMQDKDMQSQLNADLQAKINDLQVQSASASGASRALQIAREAAERDVQTLTARNQELAMQCKELQGVQSALQDKRNAIAMQYQELQSATQAQIMQLQEELRNASAMQVQRPQLQEELRNASAMQVQRPQLQEIALERKKTTSEKKAEAKRLKTTGLTNAAIAKTFNVNPATIGRWLKT